MALWLDLKVNNVQVGRLVITRMTQLDLADPGLAEKVSAYQVMLDGNKIGEVNHRYGDGPWLLVRNAVTLVPLPEDAARRMGT